MDATQPQVLRMNQLWLAVSESKDIKQLRDFLKQWDANLLSQCRIDGDNPLHWAVREQWELGIEYICKTKADNGWHLQQNDQHVLPIELAIQGENLAVIGALWRYHYRHDPNVGALFYRIATSQGFQLGLPAIAVQMQSETEREGFVESLKECLSYQSPQQNNQTLWHVLFKESPDVLSFILPFWTMLHEHDPNYRLFDILSKPDNQGNHVFHAALSSKHCSKSKRQFLGLLEALSDAEQQTLMAKCNHVGQSPADKAKAMKGVPQFVWNNHIREEMIRAVTLPMVQAKKAAPMNDLTLTNITTPTPHLSMPRSRWQRFSHWLKQLWQSFKAWCGRVFKGGQVSSSSVSSSSSHPSEQVPTPPTEKVFLPHQNHGLSSAGNEAMAVTPTTPAATLSSPTG